MPTRETLPRGSVELSPQLSVRLEELSTQHGLSKVDVLRRAFALYDVAAMAIDNNERVGLFDKNGKLIREIVGLV